MLQAEFNQLYDGLARFAFYRARQYFHGDSLAQDAADIAMDRFSDAFMLNQDIKDIEAWGNTIILNSLKNSARDKKLEPINIEGEDYEGMHGYEIN